MKPLKAIPEAVSHYVDPSSKDILGTIGNTPLIEITRAKVNPAVRVYAKLEGFNPTGSLKDRIAKYMIENAEVKGELTSDRTILEATSGNTGISLAMLAKVKGYKLTVVMPENVSSERRDLLLAYGAEVVLSDGEKGTNGAIELAKEIGRESKYFMPDQYSNLANVQAHYETTGAEILESLPKVDVFVAGLGTGGTLMGVGRRLRENNPGLKVVAVQPYPHGGLQGLRNLTDGFIPPILDLNGIDESYFVQDADAFQGVKELMDKEGIFAGISSGAVMNVVNLISRQMRKGTIVAVFPDGGWKYLSHRIWTSDPKEAGEHYKGPLW